MPKKKKSDKNCNGFSKCCLLFQFHRPALLVLVKLHRFGINWHVPRQSECTNCCLYIVKSRKEHSRGCICFICLRNAKKLKIYWHLFYFILFYFLSLISSSSAFLRVLQQNRVQSRHLQLLNWMSKSTGEKKQKTKHKTQNTKQNKKTTKS